MAKSTIDSARELLDLVTRSLEPRPVFADSGGATICGAEDRAQIAEARRLLDTLAPAETPADPVQALHAALDYGLEREWPADLRGLVARLLPEMQIATPWGEGFERNSTVRICTATGKVIGQTYSYNRVGSTGHYARLPVTSDIFDTLEEAQAFADRHLTDWVLGGGAVVAQALEGATATAEVDADGRIADDPGEEPALQPRPAMGEEPQPDASWLRLVEAAHPQPIPERATLPLWMYIGRPPDRDVSITGANAAEALRGWLLRRNLLHRFSEPTLRDYEIVTRSPLDGDWCANCGNNMDGPRFLRSEQRLVNGEEAWVCENCVETIDNQPDGSEGMWP